MSSVNLLLALSDLKVVQSVIGAMHAADRASGKGCEGTGANIPGTVDRYTPSPKFNPRVVYHPTPRFESRPVMHPTPRLEFQDASRPAMQGTTATDIHHAAVPAVPAVWKTLPNIPACSGVPQVKVVQVRPDIRHKGTLIDTFI